MALITIQLSDSKDKLFGNGRPMGSSLLNLPECQFNGAMTMFPSSEIWKAHTKSKCKFFAWLILHNKASMADNLTKKSWPCNPICPLCYCQPEIARHLLSECNYREALWDSICQRYAILSCYGYARQAKVLDGISGGCWHCQGLKEKAWDLVCVLVACLEREKLQNF
jgi:hypothetical protein